LKEYAQKGGIHIRKMPSFQIPMPKRITLRLLQWQLPIIMIWALAILLILLRDYPSDPVGASHTFMDCAEYILASLTLSSISAVFVDLWCRVKEQR
jgi:hypothetical protein